MAYIELNVTELGDFYLINTALPVRSTFFKNKKPLWERAPSSHRNNATPSAVSGHNGFDTKNTKKSAQRENPADMLAGLPYIENPGPELRENKGVPPEDIYDMITDNIISVIESDEELPWQKRYGTGFEHGLATNFVSKNAYRGINWVMLNHFRWIKEDGKKKLVRGRFSTPYFLTFNQVDDLDGSIKEGAVAQRAFFFSLLYSYEQSNPDLEFSSFDRKEFIAWLSEHSSQITGLVANEQSIKKFADQSVIPIVKYYNLFNGEDIEGIDFGGDYDDQKLSDADKLKTAELIFDSYPNKPPVKHGQQQPFYDRKKDFINMPKFGSYEAVRKY